MQQPLISVLMTSYNAEPFIARAVESVLEQSYSNWELLILDDASTDGTQSVVNSFRDARIRKIFHKKNIGYIPSKNILLEIFKGDYACFLDADDWMRSDRLQTQIEVFTKYPEIGACMCNYCRVQPNGEQVPMNLYPSSQFVNLKLNKIDFAGAGIMFSKSVVKVIGPFEIYFDRLLGDDTYWMFRIAEKFPFYYTEQTLYYYRATSTSLTASFNNLRRLTIVELLTEVMCQRLQTGSDWLEKKEYDRALSFEERLMQDKKWLAEKYRLAAAVRLDYKDVIGAGKFLKMSFNYNPYSLYLYKTVFYYLRIGLRLSFS